MIKIYSQKDIFKELFVCKSPQNPSNVKVLTTILLLSSLKRLQTKVILTELQNSAKTLFAW